MVDGTTVPNDPTGAERFRYVYVERPRCPSCGSASLLAIRSKSHDDGTTERRVQCQGCYHKFFLILE
jgi:hypothetical protein